VAGFGCEAHGGDDCDDGDATVHPEAIEVCDDLKDNDCNGMRDLADPACRPGNDTCAEPVELPDGTALSSTLRGLVADYPPRPDCGGYAVPGGPDAVFSFTLAATRDVVIDVAAPPGSGVEFGIDLELTCGDPSTSMACGGGFDSARLRRYSLPAGTYYAIVKSWSEPDFTITLTTGDPTTAPTNDTCTTAATLTPGVTAGGTTFGMMPNHETACGGMLGPDVAYRFTLAEAQDVTVEVTPFGSGELNVDLQATCGLATSSLGCTYASGSPATVRRLGLAAGSYHVIVQTGPGEAEFDITLRTTAPTPAPANDTCAGAALLDPAAGTVTADLIAAREDYVPTCGGSVTTPDVFYRLVLAEPHSVTVGITGADRAALMTTCGDRTTELLCGVRDLTRDYLAAGTYYLALEGTGEATLDVSLGTPVVPPAFDTCSGAVDVSAGGTFVGDMSRTYHDYAVSCSATLQPDVVYTFTLAAPRDVSVRLEPLASTREHAVALRTACGTAGTELRCVSGVSVNLVQRSVPAGTYFLIVAGSATAPDHRFMLDVAFGPPT
jgi:hypothetical protein